MAELKGRIRSATDGVTPMELESAGDSLACGVCPRTDALEGILVGETGLFLCAEHRRRLGDARPESFDELVRIIAATEEPRRRRERDRRRGERRMFPRPERRRHNDGRRAGDS